MLVEIQYQILDLIDLQKLKGKWLPFGTFLTLPLYNRIFGPFGHRVDIIHSKLDIKLEIVKFIFGCQALTQSTTKKCTFVFYDFWKEMGGCLDFYVCPNFQNWNIDYGYCVFYQIQMIFPIYGWYKVEIVLGEIS